MRQKCLCLSLIGWMVSTAAWSDEPVRARQPIRQRVDPKLLREALSLPEFQGKVQEPPAVTLDDLQSLSERIKKSGDLDGADLLQRFVHQHLEPTKQSARLAPSGHEEFQIGFKLIEVNFEQIPQNSILRSGNPGEKSVEIQTELNQLVSSKQAKVLCDPVVKTKTNEAVRLTDGGEFPVPTPGADGKVTIEFREFGTLVEAMPFAISPEKIRIQSTIEISQKDTQNSITLLGTTIPGIVKKRIQGTFEVTIGEPFVMQGLISRRTGTADEQRMFLIITAERSN